MRLGIIKQVMKKIKPSKIWKEQVALCGCIYLAYAATKDLNPDVFHFWLISLFVALACGLSMKEKELDYEIGIEKKKPGKRHKLRPMNEIKKDLETLGYLEPKKK